MHASTISVETGLSDVVGYMLFVVVGVCSMIPVCHYISAYSCQVEVRRVVATASGYHEGSSGILNWATCCDQN